jgi:uncharacterized membrane protein YfcA
LIFAAAAMAGAINSVAGGGTLVSFPTLLWLGVPSVVANATNTVAIWPGSLGSAWGYRRELRDFDRHVYMLLVPSVVGAAAGAVLLRLTPTEIFDRLVPVLIFFATVIFMLQDRFQRWFNWSATRPGHEGGQWIASAMVFQLVVALYGGYFGAGIGILMLAALAVMGYTDIHQMNGLKNLLAVVINGVASVYFIWSGLVSWPHAIVMTVGAILGGVGGAGVARRLGRTTVRRIVIAVGFAMATSLMFRL